jgi:chromatin modification-related protein YNG2
MDLDAEGEEEGEGEDDNLYCFCQKKSYGDVRSLSSHSLYFRMLTYGQMIACDNDECKYEWASLPYTRRFDAYLLIAQFHLSCVQLTQPPAEKWYCRECVEMGFAAGTTGQRKGRKR